ncbi:hypothetical protein SAMN05192560_0600 [Methylobacillus rhizosphaerae]|uniref:Uncharacterized protein n=1 Tax=Methylobacillus rhizosphaerae TaxID=551994 RepID=A0A238YGZ4_9PROT|nr:hypothetical protein SAMN05192560_0600 [Methylobacillus rhizosphaerae]
MTRKPGNARLFYGFVLVSVDREDQRFFYFMLLHLLWPALPPDQQKISSCGVILQFLE